MVAAVATDEITVEKAFEKAFTSSPQALTVRMPDLKDASNKETPGKKNRFILKTKGFYDLQAYVFTGLLLPDSDEHFTDKYPRITFDKLNEIDGQIYDQTKHALVKCYTQCNKFNQEAMGKFVTVTNKIIAYAKYYTKVANEKDGLKDSLEVLIQEKYREDNAHDTAYKDALEVAAAIVADLAREAKATEDECKDAVEKISAFRNDTAALKKELDFLNHQFNIGPPKKDNLEGKILHDDAEGKLPYRARLLRDIEWSESHLHQAWVNKNGAHDNWVHATVVASTTVTYVWLFPAGTIAAAWCATQFGLEATEAKKREEDAERDIRETEAKIRDLKAVWKMVTAIASQCSNIDTLQAYAIEAMNELGKLFSDLQVNMDLINKDLSAADGKLNKILPLRKKAKQYAIDDAGPLWKHVEEVAQEFVDSSGITYKEFDVKSGIKLREDESLHQRMVKVQEALKPLDTSKVF